MTAEHVHGCLSCQPDMVPDFDRDDPQYHDGEKCPRYRWGTVLLDGVAPGYTRGVFEGREGWVLFVGADASDVHDCPCDPARRPNVCLEPRFGVVTVQHLPPVLIDIEEVIRRLPKGWPTSEATAEAQASFAAGWEPFFRWLHRKAAG